MQKIQTDTNLTLITQTDDDKVLLAFLWQGHIQLQTESLNYIPVALHDEPDGQHTLEFVRSDMHSPADHKPQQVDPEEVAGALHREHLTSHDTSDGSSC